MDLRPTDSNPRFWRQPDLGDDADTTPAICGQVAGVFHGEPAIPERWLARLRLADEIRTLADRLRDALRGVGTGVGAA
jgi:hypothetical protein